MLKTYLKILFKNIFKSKSHILINILGLSIGVACSSLIFLWVEQELTYNQSFNNINNLYIVKDRQTYDGITYTYDATPGPLAKAMVSDIPGIKNTARYQNFEVIAGIGDKVVYSKGNYVDPAFLKMFSIDIRGGSDDDYLGKEKGIIISENLAFSMFGNGNAIGAYLDINKEKFRVSGVFRNISENSTVKGDWFISFKEFEKGNKWLEEWSTNSIFTFAEVIPNTPVTEINRQLYNIVQKRDPSLKARISLYPMSRMGMYNNFDQNGKEVPGPVQKYIGSFILIGWVILIIGCINFMNLATARSEKRAREVGVRKVLGAGRRQLAVQFLVESLILSFISVLFAIAIIYLLLPFYNQLTAKSIVLNLLSVSHISYLILIVIFCGVVSGIYPAFYLSSFKPVNALKSVNIKIGKRISLRSTLVTLQYAVSVTLIICTVIIYQQINFVKNRDVGYSRANLIYTSFPGNLYDVTRNQLLNSGAAVDACMSSNSVVELSTNTGDISWNKKDINKKVLITIEGIDDHYLSAMGIKLIKGRSFYNNLAADSTNIIINRTLANMIDPKNTLGTELAGFGRKFTVIGVIDDFIYNDFYKPVQPLILFANPGNYTLTIRLNPKMNVQTSIAKVGKIIRDNNPGYPFEYRFVDDQFSLFFESEVRLGKLALIFSINAILISCLGLFGLSSFLTERRSKEIGIRKIMGAPVASLAELLSRQFIKLILIACLISFPIAWYIMYRWLQDYSYRTQIYWWVFLISTLGVFLITFIVISFQIIKTVTLNPIKTLRTE